jgi:large subunit ribosomal protein L18
VKHEKIIGRQRQRRRWRVRNQLRKVGSRPRLAVFRSGKHMYAQVIDDAAGRTLACASTVEKELRQNVANGGNKAAAVAVGQLVARRALDAGVKQVAFDRREYRYHGRVAALADAARDAGLDIGAKPEKVEQPAETKKPAKGAKQPAAKQASGKKKPVGADKQSK